MKKFTCPPEQPRVVNSDDLFPQPKVPDRKPLEILQVATAMDKVSWAQRSPSTERAWWNNPDINDIVNDGVRAGYLRRPSTTQVEWTDAGCSVLKTAYTEINRGEALVMTKQVKGMLPEEPMLKVEVSWEGDDNGDGGFSKTHEFPVSAVEAHHGNKVKWATEDLIQQMSLAEDYALSAFYRQYGDIRKLHANAHITTIDAAGMELRQAAIQRQMPELNRELKDSFKAYLSSNGVGGKLPSGLEIAKGNNPLEWNEACREFETEGKLPEADSTEAMALRTQALALLQRAESIDGLKPFIVMHEHDSGTSGYLAWNRTEPNESEASAVLNAEFEEDREEVLTIESNITLEEISGVALTARIPDILDSLEEPTQTNRSPSLGM